MPRRSHCQISARLQRLLHTLVVIFVSLYIGSDVLDLDLSDFTSDPFPRERELAISEAPDSSELPDGCDYRGMGALQVLDVATGAVQINGLLREFRLRTSRSHLPGLFVLAPAAGS